MRPVLLIAAHGTRSAAGAATIRRVLDGVGLRRPDLDARLCYLDVLRPSLPEALDELRDPGIVVPLLLARGYHVLDDIPTAAERRHVIVTPPVGPDPALADVLAIRLAQAGASGPDRVVLAATGSSRQEAWADLQIAAADLGARLSCPVDVAAIDQRFAQRLTAAAADHPRLGVSAYLLAPGQFADRLVTSVPPGVPVAAPIGADPVVVDLILDRYDRATVTLR